MKTENTPSFKIPHKSGTWEFYPSTGKLEHPCGFLTSWFYRNGGTWHAEDTAGDIPKEVYNACNTPPTVKKTKTPKLTTCEKRAKDWCDKIVREGNQSNIQCFHVEWIDSATWGSNPRIMTHNGKATNVSGCGYDKLSQCLADFLRFLFPIGSGGYHAVWAKGGCGEGSIMAALDRYGWTLKKTGSGKTWDAYTLAKLPATEDTNA